MTSHNYTIGLVVPCYNEENRLDVQSFTAKLLSSPSLSILFVNDGSSDDTLRVIQKIVSSVPQRALVLSLEKNEGKGEAVRQGMLSLVKDGKHDIVGFWDADLATSLAEIDTFILEFADVRTLGVIGSRVHLAGRKIERIAFRHYIGRAFTTLMSLTFNLPIYDTQCGAKLFRAETLKPILSEPFCSRWIFDVELIVRISALPSVKGLSWLYEVPLREWKNVSGTKRTFFAYSTAVIDYIRLVIKYK